MAEIEDKERARIKKDITRKFMTVIAGATLREIVSVANAEKIKREDIVSLLKENGQFWLVYYK